MLKPNVGLANRAVWFRMYWPDNVCPGASVAVSLIWCRSLLSRSLYEMPVWPKLSLSVIRARRNEEKNHRRSRASGPPSVASCVWFRTSSRSTSFSTSYGLSPSQVGLS